MIGRTISHYKIVEKLGEGGMGVVYKAEDLTLERTVALKFPPAEALNETSTRTRFRREAQAAARLNHPNICTIYEIGEWDGLPFIAMEFVEGRELKAMIRERPLPLDRALKVAIQACEGLKAAHDRGVFHRDIKPSNLMVTGNGQVKVMDFGLAKIGGRTQLTKSGTTLGTPAYMSPEQALAKPLDQRSDVWSLKALNTRSPDSIRLHVAVEAALLPADPGRREIAGELLAADAGGLFRGRWRDVWLRQVRLDLEDPDLASTLDDLRRRWGDLFPGHGT